MYDNVIQLAFAAAKFFFQDINAHEAENGRLYLMLLNSCTHAW